jgi:hypothetical protein
MGYLHTESLTPFLLFSDFVAVRSITETCLVKTSAMGKGSSICQMEPGTREAGFEMRCTATGNTVSKTFAIVIIMPNLSGRFI